jgi:hypothetical protein
MKKPSALLFWLAAADDSPASMAFVPPDFKNRIYLWLGGVNISFS